MRSSKSSAEASFRARSYRRIDLGGSLLRRAISRPRIIFRRQHLIFGATDKTAQQARRKSFLVYHQLFGGMFDRRLAVGFIENHEASRDIDGFTVLPQQPHTDTVECTHIRHEASVVGSFAEQPGHPQRISLAALLVNVTAKMLNGEAFLEAIRYATRCVNVRVLPEPAPAWISSGPSVVSTARRCSGFKPSKSCSNT